MHAAGGRDPARCTGIFPWPVGQDRLASSFFCPQALSTPEGIEHFTELHELGLFTQEEYLKAFRAAGLEVLYDPDGLYGRGLYIGLKRTL